MNARSDRDEYLMAQVQLGKREYLEPLVRRYASPLLTFIDRMVGNRHHSEELFQEVFLSVWTKRQQYEFPRAFKSWLYAIAVNKCRARFRARPGLGSVSLDGGASSLATSRDVTPSDTLVAIETASLVAQAVTLLPAQQRAVVVLRIWESLSYEEIAQTMNCTESTARSHMHHGLSALRKYLEPRLFGERGA